MIEAGSSIELIIDNMVAVRQAEAIVKEAGLSSGLYTPNLFSGDFFNLNNWTHDPFLLSIAEQLRQAGHPIPPIEEWNDLFFSRRDNLPNPAKVNPREYPQVSEIVKFVKDADKLRKTVLGIGDINLEDMTTIMAARDGGRKLTSTASVLTHGSPYLRLDFEGNPFPGIRSISAEVNNSGFGYSFQLGLVGYPNYTSKALISRISPDELKIVDYMVSGAFQGNIH